MRCTAVPGNIADCHDRVRRLPDNGATVRLEVDRVLDRYTASSVFGHDGNSDRFENDTLASQSGQAFVF